MISNRIAGGLRGVCVAAIGLIASMTPSIAKTPGATYCFLGVCHRVLTLDETRAAIGRPTFVVASFYDSPDRDRFNPSMVTSSGEIFRPGEHDSAASPNLPDGTIIAVFAPATGRGAVVRINNAGPYWGGRRLDLSRGLAEKLGVASRGIGVVAMEVLAAPTRAEASYVYGRRYAPVPGYVGPVADLSAVRAFRPRCDENPESCSPRMAIPAATATATDSAVAATTTVASTQVEPSVSVSDSDRIDPDRRRNVTLLPVRLRRPALLARIGGYGPGGYGPNRHSRPTGSASVAP